MNISTAQKMYFNAREADGYSSNTLDMYRWALRLLEERLGNKEIAQIGEADIREFFSWIRTDYVPTRPGGSIKPLAGRSLENIWTATHSFFNFLREEGLVSGKPDHSVRRPVYTPRAIQPFTEEETRKLIKACEYTRPAASSRRKAFTMRRSTALIDVAILLVLLILTGSTQIPIGCKSLQIIA
jgi:site-specific recombinase XerD